YPAQLWLFPEDANVFPKELRDPRGGKFNASVLGEAAGGMPSDRHPMQYVPPEAAMYFASLAGCRLPTPAEWKAAYDGSRPTVPADAPSTNSSATSPRSCARHRSRSNN